MGQREGLAQEVLAPDPAPGAAAASVEGCFLLWPQSFYLVSTLAGRGLLPFPFPTHTLGRTNAGSPQLASHLHRREPYPLLWPRRPSGSGQMPCLE